MYNNDVKKVEALDKMLFDSDYREYGEEFQIEKGTFFEEYEKDFLLHLVSEEKLDKMLEDIQVAIAANDMKKVHEAMERNITPVLHNGNLVYGIHKYLHWFRGYYYQMSCTPDGQYTVNSPYFWMTEPMKTAYCVVNSCEGYEGVEEFILSLSAMTTALYVYEKTKNLLSTPEGVAEFDKFLASNYPTHCGHTLKYDTQKVLSCFKEYDCAHIPSEVLVHNAILLGNRVTNNTKALLSYSDTMITLVLKTTNGFKVVEFSMPDWYTDSKNIYAAEVGENPFKESPDTLASLIQFVLLYGGIRVSSNGFFHTRKDVDRKHTIQANLRVAWDASQLDDFICGKL